MPEQIISVSEFITQTWDDVNSPTTSTFVKKMVQCRNTVAAIEEELDTDRSDLTKLKKSVRALYNSTNKHAQNQSDIAENLDRISKSTNCQSQDINTSFKEFSSVTKELSVLLEDLAKSLHNNFQYPLESFLKGDIKGIKGDLRRPFDKAWKDYDSKYTKLEKDTRKKAQEAGFHRTELSGGEIAEEMAKERKIFQLQLCMYLIKINEIKSKKGHDLLTYLMDYHRALKTFFEQGKSTVDNYQTFVDNLSQQLKEIKQAQHKEKQKLLELQTALKTSMSGYVIKEPTTATSTPGGYSLHQLQGNKTHGSEKEGYLLKKSEGMLKKVWQKRKCRIKDGILSVSHSDETKDPVKLNLLTCQVKLVSEDPGKKCFDLVSSHGNRTYHFQADDQAEMEKWISVLSNAKEEVLLKAFQDTGSSPTMNQSVREFTRTIIDRIKSTPGNRYCCDCGAPDPDWLSTNLGVLICLECVGIHRNLGVHISRTQSIKIDQLGTSQLLLTRVLGNDNFNEVLEARLTDSSLKPKPNSAMQEKEEFIKAKYVQHKFVIQTCNDVGEQQQDLQQAIQTKDLQAILQVYAEGLDLMTVLPDSPNDETALHLAIETEDGLSLPIVDFIIQNSSLNSLVRQTKEGNTPLHLCAQVNKSECMKLLLRTKPDIAHIKNNNGETALDIATERNYQLCAELLKAAMAGRKDMFEHINIEWDLIFDDQQEGMDYTDDEAESTPDRKNRSRPSSIVGGEVVSREGSPRDGIETDGSHRHSQMPKPRIAGLNVNNNNNFSMSQLAPSSLQMQEPGSSAPPVPARMMNKKSMMPPPDVPKHFRNMSDPNKDAILLTHRRTPSEPPARPPPLEIGVRNTVHILQTIGTIADKPVSPTDPDNKPAVPPRPRAVSSGEDPRVSNRNSQESPPPVPLPRKVTRTTIRSRMSSKLGNEDNHKATDEFEIGKQKQRQELRCVRKSMPPKKPNFKRSKALFDCDADNEDELTFREGEIIVLLREEEEEWWEGEIEGQPHRRGLFPISFVTPLPD